MNMQVAKNFLISALASGRRLALKRIALLAMSVALLPVVSHATTFNIANGDVNGLIAAINSANGNGQADIINLAAGGTYTLTAVNNTGNGLPIITSSLTINGNGSTIERSSATGTPDFRILSVTSANGSLTLNNVTIRGGKGFDGGGLLNGDGATLTLTYSTVTGNNGHEGGGIFNYRAHLVLLNSTVSRNTGFGGRTGGGILNFSTYGNATVSIVNSTIFENRADGPQGFQGRGDAIADAFSPLGSIIIKNSIVASPTQGLGDDCAYFAPSSSGYNISSDNSCHLTGPGDMNNTNPLLGPLANNGGPTWTHAPLPGSPATDAVPLAYLKDAAGNPITTDQRGVARPQGAAGDIGSVELSTGPPCTQRPASMVSWWPGDGNASDIVNTAFGGAPTGTAFNAGKVGQAFRFAGTGYVQIPDNSVHYPQGSFTVDAWVKTLSTSDQVIMSKYECGGNCPSGTANSLYSLSTVNGKVVAQIRDTDAGRPNTSNVGVSLAIQTPSSIADGAFHHLAMVRDMGASKFLLYVDGVLSVSAPLNAGSDSQLKNDDGADDPLFIGAMKKAGNLSNGAASMEKFFNGLIDEVEYFNRALTATEIQNIFNANTAGKCKSGPNPPALVDIVLVGYGPVGVAVNTQTNYVYVTRNNDSTLVVIKEFTHAISTVSLPTGNSLALAVNETTNLIYVADFLWGKVYEINGLTKQVVATISGFRNPNAVAVDPSPMVNRIYVANCFGNTPISVIDGSTRTVTSVQVGLWPCAVAVNPMTKQIYVRNRDEPSNTLSVINGSSPTNAVVNVHAGRYPAAVAVNPVTNRIYVANWAVPNASLPGTLLVLDGNNNANNALVATVTVGKQPYSIAVNTLTNRAYVVNQVSNTVSVIDDSNNVTHTINLPTPASPRFIAINAATNRAYITDNAAFGKLFVLDLGDP